MTDNAILDIELNLQTINSLKETSKRNLEKYVADETIPLLDRARNWSSLPNEIKNYESWIQHFDRPFESYFNEDRNRCEIINVSEMIRDIIGRANTDEELLENLSDYFDITDEEKILKDFKNLVSSIMKKNLGSYRFDW